MDESDEGGPPGAAVIPPVRKSMGFFEHLEELRWTLIKCAVVFGVFVTIIAYWVVGVHPFQRPVQDPAEVVHPVGDDRHEDAEHHGALDERPTQLLEVLEKSHGLARGRDDRGPGRAALVGFVHWWCLAQALS